MLDLIHRVEYQLNPDPCLNRRSGPCKLDAYPIFESNGNPSFLLATLSTLIRGISCTSQNLEATPLQAHPQRNPLHPARLLQNRRQNFVSAAGLHFFSRKNPKAMKRRVFVTDGAHGIGKGIVEVFA